MNDASHALEPSDKRKAYTCIRGFTRRCETRHRGTYGGLSNYCSRYVITDLYHSSHVSRKVAVAAASSKVDIITRKIAESVCASMTGIIGHSTTEEEEMAEMYKDKSDEFIQQRLKDIRRRDAEDDVYVPDQNITMWSLGDDLVRGPNSKVGRIRAATTLDMKLKTLEVIYHEEVMFTNITPG